MAAGRPLREALIEVSELHVTPATRRGRVERRTLERLLDIPIGGDHAAVIDEGQGHTEATEQPALEVDERQHADERSVAASTEVHALVAEGALEDAAPGVLVVRHGVGMRRDERVPLAGSDFTGVDRGSRDSRRDESIGLDFWGHLDGHHHR